MATSEPIYSISSATANWNSVLVKTIETCPDASVICVSDEHIAELGASAKQRMCPNKKIEFKVVPDVLHHKRSGLWL